MDPTSLRIGTMADCVKDPLAAKMKWRLRKHNIAPEDVKAVFSIELSKCELLPLDQEQQESPAVQLHHIELHDVT